MGAAHSLSAVQRINDPSRDRWRLIRTRLRAATGLAYLRQVSPQRHLRHTARNANLSGQNPVPGHILHDHAQPLSPMNSMRRLAAIGAFVALTAVDVRAQIVERPVKFYSPGLVTVMTPFLAQPAGVRPPVRAMPGGSTAAT